MARVTLSQAGEDVIVGGADVQVIGTSAGGEVITVVSGNIRLDPSFNQGGDTIILPGDASNYTAYRSGGEVIFTRLDGTTTLRIPVGGNGTEIQFNGGDSRTLLFNGTAATIGGQTISTSSGAQTALTPAGPVIVGYDVDNTITAAVAEGDSGTRQLVFTIKLDRPVTAADGPLTLNYQTQNGTTNPADSATDYVAGAGTVTFAVGQQVATVTVIVNGDTLPELNETVNLVLSGAKLRNGAETLVGTIQNDDVAVALTANADNLQGSAGNDGFYAANNNLGAGDKLVDTSTTDNDTLSLSVDRNVGPRNFGGFTLTNIENLEVTNDSNGVVTLDLSGATGLKTVSSINSSSTVFFDQLTSNSKVILDNVTGTTANVIAFYQAPVTAGANTTVDVSVNNTNANRIILGTVGAGITGIETVNLSVTNSVPSTINGLDTLLTTLNISGGDITINDPLSNTVRTVNAATAGRVTIDFSNNDGAGEGVTFTGSGGNDVVRSGAAADNVTLGGGNDLINDEGGNDTINAGSGNDTINLNGAGDVSVDAGIGDDVIAFAAGGFNGNDKITFGDGTDTLVLNQSSSEGDYTKLSSVEVLTIGSNVGGGTNLGNNGGGSLAEAAGIRTVNLNVDGVFGGNDLLVATDYTGGLTVNLGGALGTDTVQLGSGNDTINTSSFDSADLLQGNLGVDTLNVTDGATNVGGAAFSGIEVINYVSDADGEDQVLSVGDGNAPSTGNVLTVNAGSFVTTETLNFSSTAVTAYSVNVTSGEGNDTVFTNNGVADTVTSGGGNDTLVVAGGDRAIAGAGADTITVGNGDNVVSGGLDNDLIILGSTDVEAPANLAGTGNDNLSGDEGSDTFRIASSALLTSADTISGGTGSDTIEVYGATYTDAQFTNVTGVETLTSRADGGVANITLGAEAQDGGLGITTVNLNNTGADTLVASAYTVGLTVNSAGGNDSITTGSGNDILNLGGTGSVNVNTGSGDDSIRFSGTTSLDASDSINGGLGNDVIELDNSTNTVIGTVDLARVSGVELYRVLANGDTGPGTDTNNNILTFTQSTFDPVTSVTPITIDGSALTDTADSLSVIIGPNVQDSDYSFTIIGSSTATIVEKQNFFVNSNINFIGGTGVDTLRIAGFDAGSTVTFNGGAGNDRIIQITGAQLTDDGFVGLTSVEVLGADGNINAVLGSQANRAGINTVVGTNANDFLTVGAGFTNNLAVQLGAGNDNINALNSGAVLTFSAPTAGDYTSADFLVGGTTANDRLDIVAGGAADLTNVSKVENVSVNNVAVGAEATTVFLDTTVAEADGGIVNVVVNGSTSADTLTLNGAGAAAKLYVTGGLGNDTINTGSGADLVSSGGGNDSVLSGSGNDTVNGGAGDDFVKGQVGNDTINGEDNNDTLFGDIAYFDAIPVGLQTQLQAYNASVGGNDTINGGAGNDTIIGGLKGDLLSGGDGADRFVYYSTEDSRFIQTSGVADDQRDTIDGFVAGQDVIDLTQITAAVGQTIRFNGEFQTYAEAQAAVGSTSGDGFLDVAFVRDLGGKSILFVDVDNNGQLDGNDLQILFTNKVGTLTATDVQNPHLVTGPESNGEFPMLQEYSHGLGVVGQYAQLQITNDFQSLHIA
ncbi:beta strand repeat-containing protein [Sphingomonas humi]|uniref:Calx-beta domain-containing protein n=1 Tax=Sphingomonas humi TaxID=335630 RepID=A0ABP7RX45_9SPHN